MLKTFIKTTALLLTCCFFQNAVAQHRSFSAGSPAAGIGFGNSKNYSGLRFNIRDKNVSHVNGMILTGMSRTKITRGINLGLIIEDTVSTGITVSPVLSQAENLMGIQVGGIACGGEVLKGLSTGGLVFGTKISGTSLSLITIADTMQGLTISLCGTFAKNDLKQGNVSGMLISVYATRVYSLKGLCLGASNSINVQNGIATGVYNETEELHGIQIGLWNVAKNKKIMKQMPFINFNFKRKRFTGGA